MALKYILDLIIEFSTGDTLPTTGMTLGYKARNVNTNDWYEFNGTSWGPVSAAAGEAFTEDVIITKGTGDSFASIQAQINALPSYMAGYLLLIRYADGQHAWAGDVLDTTKFYGGRIRHEAATMVSIAGTDQHASWLFNGAGYYKNNNNYLNIDFAGIKMEFSNTGTTVPIQNTGNSKITTTRMYYDTTNAAAEVSIFYSAGIDIASLDDTFRGNTSHNTNFVKFVRGVERVQGGKVDIYNAHLDTVQFTVAAYGVGTAVFGNSEGVFINKIYDGAIDKSKGASIAGDITVDTSNFSKNLSSADSTSQKAFETIDQLSLGAADFIQMTTHSVSNIEDTTVTISGTSNRAGHVIYAIYLAADDLPTKEEIAGGTDAVTHGSLICTANTLVTASITGLTADVDYIVYYFSTDEYNNSSEVTGDEFTTTLPKLSAPTLSVGSATADTIPLSWTDPNTNPNEASFSIERSLDGSAGWTEVLTPAQDVTSINNIGLNETTTYYYRIKAVGDNTTAVDSDWSNVVNATTTAADTEAPVAISDLSATDLNAPPIATWSPADGATEVGVDDTITITFDKAVRNTDASEITDTNVASLITLKETDASGTDVAFSATIDAAKEVITITPDADLSDGQQYYCAIVAVEDSAGNENSGSNITFTTENALTQLNTPSIVEIRSGDTKIGIRYDEANTSPAAASIDVIYSSDGSNWTTTNIPATGGGNEIYQITGLTNGVSYDVKLVAKGDGTTTSDSAESSVSTQSTSATPSTPTLDTLSQDYMDSHASRSHYTALCANNDGTGVLEAADFQITNFVSGGATAISVSAIKDVNANAITSPPIAFEVWFDYTGIPDGTETFDLQPADGASIYNIAGVAMAATESKSISCVGLGSEMLADNDLPSGTTVWTAADGATLGTNKVDYDNGASNGTLTQIYDDMLGHLSNNYTYVLSFDVTISSGNANIEIITTNGTVLVAKASYGATSHTVTFNASLGYHPGIVLKFYNDSDDAFSVSNLTLKTI